VSDLPLFIDPFLLFNSDKPEYQELHDGIIAYLRFLRNIVKDPQRVEKRSRSSVVNGLFVIKRGARCC
jgi:uncharacterized heparinase superfamily protein